MFPCQGTFRSSLPHVRSFPALRVLPTSPTSITAFAFLWMCLGLAYPRLSPRDHGGSPRFLGASISAVPCSQTPPGSLAFIAIYECILLPSRSSTLSAPGCCCYEAQSLHLRYGPDIALSTLNSYRYLHEPKTRFLVRRLFLLPGWELHPLKAPGFAWRTEAFSHISVVRAQKIRVLPPTITQNTPCKQRKERARFRYPLL